MCTFHVHVSRSQLPLNTCVTMNAGQAVFRIRRGMEVRLQDPILVC
jgi:hypothetical protein